jgi:hypothetical protein
MTATGWADTQVWPPQQQVVVQELEVLEETSDDCRLQVVVLRTAMGEYCLAQSVACSQRRST